MTDTESTTPEPEGSTGDINADTALGRTGEPEEAPVEETPQSD